MLQLPGADTRLPGPGLEHRTVFPQFTPSGKAIETKMLAHSFAQFCPTLCDPMDYSLPGSSFHGILQAIILEWVAISSSLFWLHWVFIAVHRLSLIVARGGLLFVALHRLLIKVASLITEYGL